MTATAISPPVTRARRVTHVLRSALPDGRDLAVFASLRWTLLLLLPVSASTDGVMNLTKLWASALLHGHNPYDIGPAAYPPLSMFGFSAIDPMDVRAQSYKYLFAGFVILVDFLGLMVATWAERVLEIRHVAIAWAVAIPLMGPVLLLWRYDVEPAALTLLALALLLADRRRGAWLALGFAIALKPYAAVLIPAMLVCEWQRGGRTGALVGAFAMALGPSVIFGLLMLPFAGTGFWEAYGFQASRAFTSDSTPAVVLLELHKLGTGAVTTYMDPSCGCLVRAGGPTELLRFLFDFALIAGVCASAYAVRAARDPWACVSAGCLGMVLLIACYPVFSPQYVVWALAPMALLASEPLGRWALGCMAGAAALSAYSYPHNYQHIQAYDRLGREILLPRTALFLATIVLLAVLTRRLSARPAQPGMGSGNAASVAAFASRSE